MRKFITVAIMLFALSTIKATAQGTGLSRPITTAQVYYAWQQFDNLNNNSPVYLTNQVTMNGLGFTPLVLNDTNNTLQFNPIIYVQSDFVTAVEKDSARSYTVLGFFQVLDRMAIHGDTIHLHHAYYFDGQVIKLLSTVTTNDSTVIMPDAGNINGAATLLWTQATYGTYKHVSIIYSGGNYYTN